MEVCIWGLGFGAEGFALRTARSRRRQYPGWLTEKSPNHPKPYTLNPFGPDTPPGRYGYER